MICYSSHRKLIHYLTRHGTPEEWIQLVTTLKQGEGLSTVFLKLFPFTCTYLWSQLSIIHGNLNGANKGTWHETQLQPAISTSSLPPLSKLFLITDMTGKGMRQIGVSPGFPSSWLAYGEDVYSSKTLSKEKIKDREEKKWEEKFKVGPI